MSRRKKDVVRNFFNIEIRKHPSFLLGDMRPTNFFTPSENYARALIGTFDNNWNILDVGCGDGVDSITLAATTNRVWGIDLAERRLCLARDNAGNAGKLNRILFLQMDAHNLAFPDQSFDLIVGNSVLLFLNRPQFLSECYRVLKPGGRALFSNESMRKHPLLSMYRLVPSLRERENATHRLSLEDIRNMTGDFRSICHDEFYLFSVILAPVVSKFGNYRFISFLHNAAFRFDRFIAKHFPAMSDYCWLSVIMLEKNIQLNKNT